MAANDWILSVLKTTPERWLNLAEMLPEQLMQAKPAPGEWSAAECLNHISALEEGVFQFRFKSILAGQDFPGFNPDAPENAPDPELSTITLAWKFNNARRNGLALVENLAQADLDKTARHADLGLVSMAELLHEWAAHDLLHTMQAERALMQPFIQGSGPWQVYFKSHIFS